MHCASQPRAIVAVDRYSVNEAYVFQEFSFRNIKKCLPVRRFVFWAPGWMKLLGRRFVAARMANGAPARPPITFVKGRRSTSRRTSMPSGRYTRARSHSPLPMQSAVFAIAGIGRGRLFVRHPEEERPGSLRPRQRVQQAREAGLRQVEHAELAPGIGGARAAYPAAHRVEQVT